MEQGLKDLETGLTRALSTGVRLALEWDANLQEQPEPEAEAPPPHEEREEPAPQPPAPPVDPMEEFKNDPLIKKALEIFKSTQQTNPA